MKKKKKAPKRKSTDAAAGRKGRGKSASDSAAILKNTMSFHDDLAALKKDAKRLSGETKSMQERLQDIEIHVNLLTRLLTTLCIEKFGMRVGVLKRMIKRIEKEAIRDSQILHLESLYKLSPGGAAEEKKNDTPPAAPPSKNDPWEDIS
ncbi:MAG: hypothetical protein FGM27_02875 [Candidatus Omnitrophica bacterium]|nr:hypothetical protein [Candidatus Omnitrophota bacterium]